MKHVGNFDFFVFVSWLKQQAKSLRKKKKILPRADYPSLERLYEIIGIILLPEKLIVNRTKKKNINNIRCKIITFFRYSPNP